MGCARPRFPSPLPEPDRRISRIRLSIKVSLRIACSVRKQSSTRVFSENVSALHH